ncbi:MAG: peptidyl-prolyl cis-trans isomerase [Acidobacteriota bacterium]|nr:peptidyl-prolyl cis-trans isomerase [Acidobacteriota bacterium]
MALKWLRDNLRHLKFILWGVVIVFVLLVFVDWGAGRAGGGGGGNPAVRVGKRTVSEQEFLNEMRRLDQRFSQIYGERWNDLRDQVDLAGQTANYFIDRELQLTEAARVGIAVTAEELREAILENPSFQREDGQFVGTETYERIVRGYFRMSPQEFETRLEEDLTIGKLNGLAERSAWVDNAEVEREFRRQREQVDLEVVRVRYEPFLTEVEMTEDESRAEYERTSADYHRSEQRVLRYLVVETSKLRRTLPVEETELRAYYEDHKDEFLEGEQANARHILIQVSPNAGEEERTDAELHANGVAQIASTGADFAELAAKHSDDTGSAAEGGDLGWFGRGRMVKEFEDAVFSAKPGEIVGPIKSQFGYHIIRVDAFRPEHQRPFEEVEEQVRFAVLEGRAAAEASSRAEELARRLNTEQPMTEEAWQLIADEDEAVVLNESPTFAAGETIPGTTTGSALADEAFAVEVGHIEGPLTVPRGWMVWQLAEIRPEGIQPFEDVRLAVEQSLRREKAFGLARQQASTVVERWRAGDDAAVVAEEIGSSVTEAAGHRRGAQVGDLGILPAIDQVVFDATVGDVLEPIDVGNNGIMVVRVTDVVRADQSELAAEMENLRARLMADRAGQLMRSILNERRRDTVVTVDNELLQRFATTSS